MSNDILEAKLESEFTDTLRHVEAKTLLSDIGIKSTTIRGAITRFCKQESVDRPTTFTEMTEDFMPDFMDFWMDTNPEIFELYPESKVFEAVEKYLAFTTVWKHKVKNNYIITSELRLQASTLLVVKNSLAASMKAVLSYNKRQPKIEQEKLIEAMPKIFLEILPVIHALQNGLADRMDDTDDLTRLIGSYLAGDKKTAIDIVNGNKLIENKISDICSNKDTI